jgi:long-chain acyl-CoA synthetase
VLPDDHGDATFETLKAPPEAVLTREQAIDKLTAPGQPFELETVELYGASCRAFKQAPPTLRALFEDARSDATFIVFDDERYSFEEAYQRAATIAHILVNDFGVGKGDRVAISMRNFPEWIFAFTAVTSIGAIAVAMNALWTPEEMAYGLTDSGAKVLFADAERLERLANCSPAPTIQTIAVRPDAPVEDGTADLARLLRDTDRQPMPETDLHPNDPATILYTSGSTGHPKGAVSCHRNIITALLSWELEGQIGALRYNIEPTVLDHQPATLLAVPLFHATGSHAVYLASYRSQRKIVSMYRWSPAHAAELIESERISSFVAPAAMTGDLVQEAAKTNRDLSSLAMVGGGGAPRAPEQVKSIDQSFANAMPNTGWGMTETNAIGTGIGGPDYLNRPASSGRCAVVLDLRVVDENGRELPAGERGELLIRGTSVISGYWQRPDANAETFTDGWLRTGDVAYLDDEGYLFIVDRIKDLVIRGGENIGCGEVEAALVEHPRILEASVYAVPDERLGEEVGATVYSEMPLSEDEIRDFLAPHLARFQIPRYLFITSEPLPRIASGKIFKRQLREDAVNALTRSQSA